MSRRKEIALVTAGILAGIAVSGPAAQAAAGLLASSSSQQFYLNGQNIHLEAYEINGSNYVKLRDVGQAVGFGVTYDAATNSVHISPDQPYTEEAAITADRDSGDGYLTNGKPVTEENVLEILRQIEKNWPRGTAWDETTKNEVPSTEANRIIDNYPVNHSYGCGGYAAMVSSLIFGDTTNPGYKLEDSSQLRPGDILFRVNNETGKIWHVAIALESPNSTNAFHITDGSCGGTVHWPDRQAPYGRDNLDFYRGEFTKYHLEVWTRYPENVPYTGNSVGAWPTGVSN